MAGWFAYKMLMMSACGLASIQDGGGLRVGLPRRWWWQWPLGEFQYKVPTAAVRGWFSIQDANGFSQWLVSIQDGGGLRVGLSIRCWRWWLRGWFLYKVPMAAACGLVSIQDGNVGNPHVGFKYKMMVATPRLVSQQDADGGDPRVGFHAWLH